MTFEEALSCSQPRRAPASPELAAIERSRESLCDPAIQRDASVVFLTARDLHRVACFDRAVAIFEWLARDDPSGPYAVAAAMSSIDALQRQANATPGDAALACFETIRDRADEWLAAFPGPIEARAFGLVRCEALRVIATREAEHDRERASRSFEQIYRASCPSRELALYNAVVLSSDPDRAGALDAELRRAFPAFERPGESPPSADTLAIEPHAAVSAFFHTRVAPATEPRCPLDG
jgi:hypothetical protein